MSLYSQNKTGKGCEKLIKIRKTNEWRGGAKIFAPKMSSFFINDKGENVKKITILVAILLILFFLTVTSDPGQEFGATQGVAKSAGMVAPFLVGLSEII